MIPTDHAIAIAAVVVVWWASTGLVLRLVWLPTSTHRVSMAVFSVLAVLGGWGALASASMDTTAGAYLGFASAIAVWAWHELAFLLGRISGPRKQPCEPQAAGWRRFVDATATLIHHEIALAITALVLFATAWGQPNPVAAGTFIVLWAMRLSAKLNVFVGVRNVSSEFVPPRLRYLTTYFRSAPWSPLMPVSLVLGGLALAQLTGTGRLGDTLMAAILALGLLEHVFLALPLPDAALWRWLLPRNNATAPSVKRGVQRSQDSKQSSTSTPQLVAQRPSVGTNPSTPSTPSRSFL